MKNHPENQSEKERGGSLDVVAQKLADLDNPGFQVELDPAEAEAAGAFIEDAIQESEALEAAHDSRDLEHFLFHKRG